jgi:flagellar motor protein MotB
MATGKKNISTQEEDDPGGAPEWMVTFSDCMTLLLTFFVLLLSFSSFDKETLPALGQSFAKALPSISVSKKNRRESMLKRQPSSQEVDKTEATETPLNAVEQTTNFMKEKKPLDFQNLKVFTIESKQFFWGQGYAFSKDGREVLNTLANYLKHRTGRIVISENGPDGNTSLGLHRSIAVMDYLTKKHALDKARFNISCATTMRQPPRKRQLEITLLDRSIYE